MKNYRNEILNQLIDKYERSRSFSGENAVKQNFSVEFVRAFPEYADDSKVSEIQAMNQAADELEERNLITVRKGRNGLRQSAVLNISSLADCYELLKRKPRKELNSCLESLLKQYLGQNEILDKYCENQLERVRRNKNAEYFDGDLQKYENVLKAVAAATQVKTETYRRTFSVQVFGDSKQFEKILGTVENILFRYGDFSEKETVLEDLNIIRNPGHVYFKGSGQLKIAGQEIDLSKLNGDIAVSSAMLGQVEEIRLHGSSIITIENLTTFNSFDPQGAFVIYLGGYHNTVRRQFIQKLYRQHPEKAYYHYGDIDAGGFHILLHLRERTGVPFQPLNMDIGTIRSNLPYTKKLTENDRRRLEAMAGGEFDEVIQFMLKHNCKLEQEAVETLLREP